MSWYHPSNREPMYSVKDVAEMIGITTSSLYSRIKHKTFPQPDGSTCRKLGKKTRQWKRSTILKWLQERENGKQ